MRIFLISLILIISLSGVYCEDQPSTLELPQSDSRSLGASVTDYLISADTNSSVKNLAELYKRALVREKLGAYDNALSAYGAVTTKAIDLLNDRSTTVSEASNILPYAIASAYRKGILTHRTIEGSVVKLYRQLEMYQEADSWINEVLTSISNLTTEKGMSIAPTQYYPLYYARAYNRLGWSYALLNGSAWKRYIIYTPADTITMVDKSMGDLSLALGSFDIDYTKDGGSSWGIEDKAEKSMQDMTSASTTYVTFALSFNTYKISGIKTIVKKQLSKTIKDTLDTYNSATVMGAFNYGRKIFTYEEFMKPETKDVVAAMANLLEDMK